MSAWAGDKECMHISKSTCTSNSHVSLLYLLVLLSHGCNASASESRPKAPVLASVLGAICSTPRKSCTRHRAIKGVFIFILYTGRTSHMSLHLLKKHPAKTGFINLMHSTLAEIRDDSLCAGLFRLTSKRHTMLGRGLRPT